MSVSMIPIEVSARHLHLSADDVVALFGDEAALTPFQPLSQHGQFAAHERAGVSTKKASLGELRIVGPVREQSQVELAMSDARKLGLVPPLRISGDLADAATVTLTGPKGTLEKACAIVAWRHIHTNPSDAKKLGIAQGQFVRVKISGDRGVMFDQVAVRVHEQFQTRLHLDTDEGNACGFFPGMTAELLSN